MRLSEFNKLLKASSEQREKEEASERMGKTILGCGCLIFMGLTFLGMILGLIKLGMWVFAG